VSETIRQRVGALPEEAAQLPGAAAVIGRVVPYALLAAVASAVVKSPETNILSALDAACRAHLVEERDEGLEGQRTTGVAIQYQFAHDLIREVVLRDLSAARRARLHFAAGDALEQLSERERNRRAAGLAHHFACADQHQRALQYSIQAAERAREAGARREEAALLGQALDAATRMNDRDLVTELHAKRGQALNAAAMWLEVRLELEAALASLTPDQAARRIAILVELASASSFAVHFDMRGMPRARGYATEARALAESIGRADLAARAMSEIAVCDTNEGLVRESLTRFERAFARAGADHDASMLNALDQYGVSWYWLGYFAEAEKHTRRALTIARSVHDSAIITRTLGNLGRILTGCGRYDEALKTFSEARRCGREYGTWQWLARSISMCAGLHLALWNSAGAEALTEEAREVNRGVTFPNVTASTGVDLLLTFARGHDPGRAEGLLPSVREDVTKALAGHGWLMAMRFAQAQAEVAFARGALDGAKRCAEDSIAQARQRGRVKYEVLGMQTYAQAVAGLGRTKEAIAELRAAINRARPIGDPALFLRIAAALLTIEGDDALLAEAQAAVERIVLSLPDDLRHILLDAEPAQLVARLSR
jgi:tetratricopeptide (TPR) repeat protein